MVSSTITPGLTDTDILIDAMRGLPDAVAFVTAQRTVGGLQISVISAMELTIGCRDAAELAHLEKFLKRIPILPLGTAISQTAYRLVQSFFLSHGMLIPDALIAATALDSGLILYTKNTRHFQMISALRLARPY